MKYVVIDNWFTDPDKERHNALISCQDAISHDGHSYPAMSQVDDTDSVARLREALECDVERSATVVYRRYPADVAQPTFIHNDSNIATVTAVICLNKDTEGSGLAFWKHRKYGWDGQPTVFEMRGVQDTPRLWTDIVQDGLTADPWQRTDMVPMAYNRLIAFQSKHYHSRWPHTPSPGQEDRLIKVIFYKL